jgi:hypothetical protein
MEKLKIIIGGFLGILPAGGVAWDYVQYPLGFSMLGHDVYYIEDTRLFPIYQSSGTAWDDASDCVNQLKNVMESFGLGDRWAYRDEASGNCFGMSMSQVKKLCSQADLFVNLSCSTCVRDEYLQIPKRVLIDTDPMFTQIQLATQQKFTRGESNIRNLVDAHNFHFTFGENIGHDDCQIPQQGFIWRSTRQPICMEHWAGTNPFRYPVNLTTIMNWTVGQDFIFADQSWGQKDIEFQKIISIPGYFKDLEFTIVANQKSPNNLDKMPTESISQYGWKILNPQEVTANWRQYRQFIYQSSGEFSVAKQTYVKANTGWFSCRSACYLASGKPVITQETGWSRTIPEGVGLFAFQDLSSALISIDKLLTNPAAQAFAAREIAEEYFDSRKVLNALLSQLN